MKNDFDISLPSIPSKNMRFKLQAIFKPAFGSIKERFPDRKSSLTYKFISSFNNLHEQKNDKKFP